MIIIFFYIALYHALLKALLHKASEILFYERKEIVEFEIEKLYTLSIAINA